MKQRVFIIGLIVVFSIALTSVYSIVFAAEESVPAKDAVEYLDKKKYTKAQIRDYYRGLKRKTIHGEGTVANVRPARKNYEICVLVSGTKYHRECNLVINTPQEEALDLKKGQRISFEGRFVRLTPFVNYCVIIKGGHTKIK